MHRIAVYPVALLAAPLPVIFDSALKGTVLLGLVAMAVVCMRNASAAARHLAWMLGIIGLLLLPLLSAVLPGWRVLPPWAGLPLPAPISERPTPASVLSPTPDHVESTSTRTLASVATSGAFTDRSLTPGPAVNLSPLRRTFSYRDPALWFSGAWISVAVLLLLRLGSSIFLLHTRNRAALAVTEGPLQQALESGCLQLRIRQRVRLFVDGRRIVPLVWGVFRPRLALPVEAREWEPSRLRAVLLHELAHVKRHDVLVMLLSQIACAVHWFNPLAWLAAWRLHVERECACDNLVITSGVKPSDYAEHLLHVATRLETASPAGALAMARPSRLEGRLMAVLNQQLQRGGVTGSIAVLAAAVSLGVIIPVAMLKAQDPPAKPRDPGAEKPRSQHTIEVKADGSLALDAAMLSYDALAEKLTASRAGNQDHAVTVRAEKNAPYTSVAKVLEACRSVGIANVTIATATDEDQQTAKASVTGQPGESAKSDPAEKIARARLEQAERELERTSELHHQKTVSQAELDRARAEVEIRKAELAGDATAVMRARLQLAERELERLSELNKQKLVSQQELDRAKAEVEIRKAELAGDSVAVMRARLQLAERELERLGELNRQKLVSQQELDRAKAEVEIRKAELAGDPIQVKRTRLQLAEHDLERLIPLYEQKLVSQQEIEEAKANVDLRKAEFTGDNTLAARGGLKRVEAELDQPNPPASATGEKIATTTWQPFSQERVDQALKAGRPVFIQFTADWSLDAKANELRVLNTAAVSSAFTSRNVLTLKADWTDGNTAVTEWLRKFAKPGVPLYILYMPGKAEPHVFPGVLTADDIVRQLSPTEK